MCEFEKLIKSDRRVKPITKKYQVSFSSASLPTTVPTVFARSEAKVIFKVFPRSVRIPFFFFKYLIMHPVTSNKMRSKILHLFAVGFF